MGLLSVAQIQLLRKLCLLVLSLLSNTTFKVPMFLLLQKRLGILCTTSALKYGAKDYMILLCAV